MSISCSWLGAIENSVDGTFHGASEALELGLGDLVNFVRSTMGLGIDLSDAAGVGVGFADLTLPNGSGGVGYATHPDERVKSRWRAIPAVDKYVGEQPPWLHGSSSTSVVGGSPTKVFSL